MINAKSFATICIAIFMVAIGCSSKKTPALTDEQEISKTIKLYGRFINTEDYDKLANLIHPEAFKDISRKQLSQGMLDASHTNQWDMFFDSIISFHEISPVINNNSNKYVLIASRSKATIILKKNMDSLDYIFPAYCNAFKKEFGDTNLICDATKRQFVGNTYDTTYMIYEKKYKKWFLLNATDPESVSRIIPADVLKQLKQ